MRNRIILLIFFIALVTGVGAQQLPTRPLRIVDSLSAIEKASRNTVILRSELDSMVKAYNAIHAQSNTQKQEPVIISAEMPRSLMVGALFIAGLLITAILFLWMNQKRIIRLLAEREQQSIKTTKEKTGKGKLSPPMLEAKISDLSAELHKLSKENEGLSRVIKEYNGIQHEYDSLKHGLLKAYKVKNYPGNEKTKDETTAMQSVLDTENSVASYAYEKFLKPILAIVDANKNNPARLNAVDREKLVDLLVSLSLLYIEYLYLRINDLAIGGKMVERIKGFSNGNGIDASLLKKLNTEFGSRALVVKLALEKTGVNKLSYPVFDETNLNN